MKIHHLDIDPAQVSVHPGDIIALLGDENGVPDSYTEDLLEQCILNSKECMKPQASFTWLKALDPDSKEHILIEGDAFKTGKIIQKMLAGSEAFAFMIATLGPGPESLARELMEKGEFLEGYITDLVASALIESIANQVQGHIMRIAGDQGLLISNRYSPGYCSWDVSEQQKLFDLFPKNCCDITLTESCLMSPIKSISALIGIGSSVKYQEYTCEICSMKNCVFRKTRNSRKLS